MSEAQPKSGQTVVIDAKNAVSVALQRVKQPHGGELSMWPKGMSGNPAGRPSAGMSCIEWMNEMRLWTEDQLRAVVRDKSAPKLKRSAARSMMRSDNPRWHNATPLAANDLDRIMDRTSGKPTQRIEVAETTEEPSAILEQLSVLLASASQAVRDEIAAALPAGMLAVNRVIDTETPGEATDGQDSQAGWGGAPNASGATERRSLSFVQPVSKLPAENQTSLRLPDNPVELADVKLPVESGLDPIPGDLDLVERLSEAVKKPRKPKSKPKSVRGKNRVVILDE